MLLLKPVFLNAPSIGSTSKTVFYFTQTFNFMASVYPTSWPLFAVHGKTNKNNNNINNNRFWWRRQRGKCGEYIKAYRGREKSLCVVCPGQTEAYVSMTNEYRKTIHKHCPLSARLEKQYPIAGMHAMLLETLGERLWWWWCKRGGFGGYKNTRKT